MGDPAVTGQMGRSRQRRRTRKAILAAAMDLLARGETPSIADIADAADVSRRTVYMYFSTLEQLLIDATVGALSEQPIDDALTSPEVGDDAHGRVEVLVRALTRMAADTLPLGRTLLRLTVEHPVTDDGNSAPQRGYRRIEWIERALDPLRVRLSEPDFERLVSAVAVVVGWEAMIVLFDIRGLSPTDAEETMVWAAQALIAASLDSPGWPRRPDPVG